MPTIILLDVSLSMCRTVRGSDSNRVDGNFDENVEMLEVRQLANVGIGCLLDYFAQNAQLEYTALLIYSSLYEIKHQFTRHHESIKNGIYDLELYDKSNVINAIRGMLSLKLKDWTQNGPINIVLITDGQIYHRSMCHGNHRNDSSVSKTSNKPLDEFGDIGFDEIQDQFDFPCKMQVVCLASPSDPVLKYGLPFYKKLISCIDKSVSSPGDCPVISSANVKGSRQSAIWLPDSDSRNISIKSIENLFSKMLELHYKPYHTTLSCGHLTSFVMLSPNPTDHLLQPLKNEFDALQEEPKLTEGVAEETYVSAINRVRLYKLSDEISICGFMPISDIASPAVTSRHLVLPIPDSKFNETFKAEQILSKDPNDYSMAMHPCAIGYQAVTAESSKNNLLSSKTKISDLNDSGRASKNSGQGAVSDQDITKQPSFCVLLHNSLKQENMVAICSVGKSEDSSDDWFGMIHPHTDSKKRSSLMLSLFIPGSSPVLWLPDFKSMGSSQLNADLPPSIRDKLSIDKTPVKSYSSNSVIWLDPESVQLDVQKIVRHAKRTPDRAPHFYKELNRIRRAAISYGFYDVLIGLADILKREQRLLVQDPSRKAGQETLNQVDHVIACLRGSLDESSYDTVVGPVVNPTRT